jgi:hypothetical protein
MNLFLGGSWHFTWQQTNGSDIYYMLKREVAGASYHHPEKEAYERRTVPYKGNFYSVYVSLDLPKEEAVTFVDVVIAELRRYLYQQQLIREEKLKHLINN